ncbi:MAG: KilA-N domain-containing protein [Bacteroidales bacterium]|nr:KilA-N domain-containing protein [Bacteroidales bacterium]
MSKKETINVQGTEITVIVSRSEDYISLTDMANAKEGQARAADIIKNWIRTRTTLEFLGTWEQMYNPDFKVVEFDHFKMQAGLPSFVLSPGQWIEKTNAVGISVKQGKYGGTYARRRGCSFPDRLTENKQTGMNKNSDVFVKSPNSLRTVHSQSGRSANLCQYAPKPFRRSVNPFRRLPKPSCRGVNLFRRLPKPFRRGASPFRQTPKQWIRE